MTRVTIAWMHGLQETYDCASTTVANGVLYLQPKPGDPRRRAFPLFNIRTWTEE